MEGVLGPVDVPEDAVREREEPSAARVYSVIHRLGQGLDVSEPDASRPAEDRLARLANSA